MKRESLTINCGECMRRSAWTSARYRRKKSHWRSSPRLSTNATAGRANRCRRGDETNLAKIFTLLELLPRNIINARGRLMKVFISHSSKDEVLASKIASYLEDAGLEVWYDKREIMPGDNWADKIAQGLRESDAMVVLLSEGALSSEFMRRDIDYALSQKPFRRRVVPVFVGYPRERQDDVPWIFDRLQSINLKENGGNEHELEQLAQVLKDAA
ncbi:MAG: hypothetical protein DMF72_03810 [Acidobacteria bacterium]|nr:MAG: hypothetical protein DMF72_03810 [Acidobacteriota bacterium]